VTIELRVPPFGESISEVTVGEWLRSEGESVHRDDPVVVIETDKVTSELPSPADGRVVRRLKVQGETAAVGDVIAIIEEAEAGAAAPAQTEREAPPKPAPRIMPSAQREISLRGLDAGEVEPSGPGGRILKEDVLRADARPPADARPHAARPLADDRELPPAPESPSRGREEIIPMSPLRQRIAARLVEAQNTAALVTTVNEIDMTEVVALRARFQDDFRKRHGAKLGFMSFFVRAVVDAISLVPGVNAEVRGADIVRRDYCDIGIAVATDRGLVVPVLRNAERLGPGAIEAAIADFAARAREGRLELAELTGSTFTISNGGIFGSLLSTPIVNPPESGILGLHAIQDRPVARDGAVVIRPMMYVALTYDHRIVDGREAVTFLRRVKECVESPARIVLEV